MRRLDEINRRLTEAASEAARMMGAHGVVLFVVLPSGETATIRLEADTLSDPGKALLASVQVRIDEALDAASGKPSVALEPTEVYVPDGEMESPP